MSQVVNLRRPAPNFPIAANIGIAGCNLGVMLSRVVCAGGGGEVFGDVLVEVVVYGSVWCSGTWWWCVVVVVVCGGDGGV